MSTRKASSSHSERLEVGLLTKPEGATALLTYEKKPKSDIAEIVVEGKITDEEMDSALAKMKADLDSGARIKLLEEVRSFEGMAPTAFFKDPRFGFSMMKGVTHVALVTDVMMLKMAAEAFSFVSPTPIKVFERARIDDARAWLAAA